jgi:uncharacterized membrane protein YfcA
MTDLIGYLAFIFMGLIIGMMGSGGTIITVPILVYLFHINPNLATTYSLIIVGITSMMGSISYIKNKQVHFKIALLFSIPSIISVFITRNWIVPNLPDVISFKSIILSKSQYIMVIFAIFMLAAFYSIISSYLLRNKNRKIGIKKYYGLIPIEAILIGFITGLVGAGGGFLIIPSLMLFNKLPIKKAIGTSLVLIAINSTIGFFSTPNTNALNYIHILAFVILSIFGVFIGSKINNILKPEKLKLSFGFFILTMGLCILCKELLLKVN